MAVAFNVNLNMSKTNQTSLLALANVEALAGRENPSEEEYGEHEVWITVKCSKQGQEMEGGIQILCIPDEMNGTCVTFNPCV